MANVEIKLVRGGPGGEHQIVTIKGVKIKTFYAAMLLMAGVINDGFPKDAPKMAELLSNAQETLDKLMDDFD